MVGSEVDTTGVVTKISGNSCYVTITIDDVQKTFSCSKLLVYACGYQCEGQLTALLDDGADVEVRYKLSNENIPVIVAVWCGELPDHLSNDSRKLRSCYDQKGHVVGVRADNYLVQILDGNHNVLINREVIFREGCRFKNGSGLLSIKESVTFDAIPFEIDHPSGAVYQATCAWVGQTPRLCERFGLQTPTLLDDPWDNGNPVDVVHGVVSVIPNEVIAFAEAEFAQNSSKVLLMRSSFALGCCTISDMVSVGDKLCMQVRFGYMFRNTRQWFAVHAWKDGSEVLDGLTDGSSCKAGTSREDASSEEERVEEKNSCAVSVGGDGQASVDLLAERRVEQDSPEPAQIRKRTRRRNRRRSSADNRIEKEFSTETEESSTESAQEKMGVKFDKNSGVLKADPPLSGVASIVSKDTAYISYRGLKVAFDKKVLFHNGKPCSDAQFVLLLTTEIQEVNFEAVKTKQSKYIKLGFSHQATCVWVGQRPSVSTLEACDSAHTISKPQSKKEISNAAPQSSKAYLVCINLNFDEASPVLFDHPPLHGFLTDVSGHHASIAYDDDINVYVSHEDCYFDLLGGELVNFEAVKTDKRDGFSHEATCVWVGYKPTITEVVSKTLPPMEFCLLEDKELTLVGVVRRFCLPKVALVVVEDVPTTVCLHVSAFGCKSKKMVDYASGKDCINQFVKLGDAVRFKLSRAFNVLSATDVKVLKAESPETSGSDARLDSELDRIAFKVTSSGEEMRGDTSTSDVGPLPLSTGSFFPGPLPLPTRFTPHDREGPSRLNILDDEEKGSQTVDNASSVKVAPPFKKTPGIVYKAVPFRRITPSMMKTWHIGCAATLDVDVNQKVVKLPPTKFSVDYTDKENLALRALVHPEPVNEESLSKYQTKSVCFDGIEKDGLTCVNRLWEKEAFSEVGLCPSIAYEMYMASRMSLSEGSPLNLPQPCRCKIVSLPFYDLAVGGILESFSVSISLQSLVTEEDVNCTLSSIDAFLNIGDEVCVAVKSIRSADGPKYLVAETCWKVVKLGDSEGDDQVQETVERKRNSWSDMWVDGGLFSKGTLEKTDDLGYTVKNMKGKQRWYDIPRKNFWVNKKLTEPSDGHVGKEVTFHLARDSDKREYIKDAWTGETPSAVEMFKDRYSVPCEVISSNWFYEGIIEDFPLPTRALCRIGAAPVLVEIGGGAGSGKFIKGYCRGGNADNFVEVDNVNLVTGSLVCMRVLCRPDFSCIESRETTPLKSSAGVVINLRGTVTSLPRPVGMIEATSKGLGLIEASFELVSVQVPEGMSLHKDEVRRWFEFLKDSIAVGTPVHLTAIKSKKRYRAVRVYVDESRFSRAREAERPF